MKREFSNWQFYIFKGFVFEVKKSIKRSIPILKIPSIVVY